jgi:hypothetical protein
MNFLGQIAVGGGDDLPAEEAIRRFTEALERPKLQRPQELHLDGEVHLADFIQKDRAGILADIQPAGAIRQRSREGALPMAKEFRFNERGRQSRQMQRVKASQEARRELSGLGVEGNIPR